MRDHDELLRRYLLGKLGDEERSRLEERLLREEDLFETVEAIDADLLDDYAHDRLAPEEREQVAHRLAFSPRSRTRLAMIRGLGTIAKEDKKTGRVLPFRWTSVISRPEIRAAAAIAATVVFSVNVYYLRPLSLVQPSAEPKTEFHTAWNPSGLPPGWDSPVPRENPHMPPPPPIAPLVIPLDLNTLRGDDRIPEWNVPPETRRVQLYLQMEEADKGEFASFQTAVRREGSEVSQADLKPSKIDGKWTLILDLDPQHLPAGMYEVEVSGVASPDSLTPIAFKELEITRNASAAAVTPD